MRTLGQPSEAAELRRLAQRVFNLERARGEARVARTGDKMTGRLVGPTGLDPISPDEYARKAYVDSRVTGTGYVPYALFDAKGDLLIGTANDTAARLPVGTAGQYLTPDSATATGLKWATPNPPSCRVFRSTVRTVPHNTEDPLEWTNAVAPPGSGWETMWLGNSGFLGYLRAPWDGEYLVYFSAMWWTNGPAPDFADAYTGYRVAHLIHNSEPFGPNPRTIIDDHQRPTGFAGGAVTHTPSRIWRFAANEVLSVDMLQYQTTAGPLNLGAYPEYSPHLGMTWLRP